MSGCSQQNGSRNPDLEQAIRRRAQELYQQRGCVDGHQLEDWLQAEAEIRARHSSASDFARIALNIGAFRYVGEYNTALSGDYHRGEFKAGDPIHVRFAGDRLFLRRPNGVELEIRIIEKTANK